MPEMNNQTHIFNGVAPKNKTVDSEIGWEGVLEYENLWVQKVYEKFGVLNFR